jgi:Zn-dependent protease
MIKPAFATPGDDSRTVARLLGTRLVVKGWTWLPVVQVVAWLALAWHAGRVKPQRTWGQRLAVGAITMPVLLGSEWLHNLGHAAAAQAVGKPMDALRVLGGMPLCVYYDVNDGRVAPREHVARALGGPLVNAALWLALVPLRAAAHAGSPGREVLDVAVAMNAFLCSYSLLPIPGIDGGPLLKWSLVARGRSVAQADLDVRRVNWASGVVLAAATLAAWRRGRRFLALLLGQFSALSLAIASGALREQA